MAPLEDPLIRLSELAKAAPELFGTSIGYSTVRQWAKKGVHGVVLESRLIGGRRYTTIGAVRRFLDKVARR